MPNSRFFWDGKVPMRDGVDLSANVYFPKGEGPFPTVLVRTPYGKDTALRAKQPKPFVEAGYAVAQMDVRGRGNS